MEGVACPPRPELRSGRPLPYRSATCSWATPSRSPSSIFANDDTRPTLVIAAPVRAARPCGTLRGCTARPDSRLRTAVSSAGRAESLGF
eukprot:scaffold41682_cov104-Phaeocystis_antarctica.AAC.3